jgi:hypothetical protein
MGWLLRKKLLAYMAAAFTAMCVMGYFALTVLEPLRSINFEVKNSASNRISGSVEDNSFPNPEMAIITKPGNSVSSPNMGLQRTVALSGTPSIGNGYAKSPFMQGVKTHYLYLKNTIILKLRI